MIKINLILNGLLGRDACSPRALHRQTIKTDVDYFIQIPSAKGIGRPERFNS